VSRSEKFPEDVVPVSNWFAIHSYYNVADDRGPYSFVLKGKANHGVVARIVFEDRPDRRADLLALHLSGVTGNKKRGNTDKGRNDCLVVARKCSLS
jgi:hypothetical protein